MLKVSMVIQRGSIDMLASYQDMLTCSKDMVTCSQDMLTYTQDIMLPLHGKCVQEHHKRLSGHTHICPLDIIGNSRDMETGSKYMSAC
jgi:hypothetical protein